MPYNMAIVSPNEKKKKNRLTDRKLVGIKQQQKQTASQLIFLHLVKRINNKWGKLKNIHRVLKKCTTTRTEFSPYMLVSAPHRRWNEIKWKKKIGLFTIAWTYKIG